RTTTASLRVAPASASIHPSGDSLYPLKTRSLPHFTLLYMRATEIFRFKVYRYAPWPLALLSGLSVAAETTAIRDESQPLQLKYSVSLGVQHRSVKVSDPTSPYRNRGTSVTAGLSRPIDNLTVAGLTLSYSLDHSGATNGTNNGKIEARSVSANLSRYIGGGRIVSATLGYGNSDLNNRAGTNYSADTDTLSGSIGIVQFIPFSENLAGSIGLSYGRVLNHIESYTNSAGTRVDGIAINSNALSLSGGLRWNLGPWTPSVNLGMSRASKKLSMSSSNHTAINYGFGLGYDLGNQRSLNISYSSSLGLKNVRDNNLGASLSFPF
ncbi:MAG: autotransporter outer membrane beta-barrel domain-containing protein, partial [Rhodocyclaceae bacterium]|nr:autotransporter outer membrane beta-barrel domain-containing protein [Rhodocyclaceae bacterium]MDZ4215720.1 autotransporter outer membrane beta-barrel domain-containing protein [Rhodocyclaceae bacterium]